MALSEKDVRYVAELAHLELSEEEVKRFLPQLDAIVAYIQQLNELDTAAVEPMAQVITASDAPALRRDESHPTFTSEEALSNAPQPGAGFFRVPRVIEREE